MSYLSELHLSYNYSIFKNSKGIEIYDSHYHKILIPENSFSSSEDSIIVKWRILNNAGQFISTRSSLNDSENQIISDASIINLQFFNKSGNSVTQIKPVLLYIPYNYNQNHKLFRTSNSVWYKTTLQTDILEYSDWTTTINETVENQSGYKISIMNEGTLCIGICNEFDTGFSGIKVELPDEFNVDNSIVQISVPDTNINIEMDWNSELKLFVLPENIIFPYNSMNITVLAEDTDNNPFFGMKYAVIDEENPVFIDLDQVKIEEIKTILNSI
ncbi:MAG: hypothetical protein R2771_04510 [Saprospiraceae bacterium]